ncbi:MAG: LPS export ABC transporter permease LptF [Rubrimonas sp.]
MPARIDRYILRELAKPFLFFVIVFTAIIWLTQSLRIVETVLNSGQTAGIFVEFIALLLPAVFTIVLPLAAFGATLYTINKLFAESELVALASAGVSNTAIARPVALFGAAVMIVTAANTLYLAPMAQRDMRARVHELRTDIVNALVFEGRFLHPASGVTIYVRENDGGVMGGVFVHDSRDPAAEVTYTASRAVITQGEDGPRLVMFEGAAQRKPAAGVDQLSLLQFETLVFDLSQFMTDADDRSLKPSERFVTELLSPRTTSDNPATWGRLLAEGHEQIVAPVYALVLPLVGVAVVLAAGFSRRGYGQRIALAIVAAALIRTAGILAKSLTSSDPALWPLFYAPPIIGLGLAFALLTGRLTGFRVGARHREAAA